jgi:hypothetical protein
LNGERWQQRRTKSTRADGGLSQPSESQVALGFNGLIDLPCREFSVEIPRLSDSDARLSDTETFFPIGPHLSHPGCQNALKK